MMPPPGFLTPPHIPSNTTSERLPITTIVFAATTPENTPFAYHASTSTNPNPTISPAFVKANYEILESLLRERQRQIRNEDLQTELEYFSPLGFANNEKELWDSRTHQTGKEIGGEGMPKAFTNNSVPLYNGPMHPVVTPSSSYPFYAQPIYAPPNMHVYLNPAGPFADFIGLHEEQRISGFVHGLKIRSLVEHLSTDLPSTYKGLMEKTYTWVEAREVATNGVLNNRRDVPERSKKFSWDNNIGPKDRGLFSPYKGKNHKLLSNLVKSPREILATEKVAKTFEQPPRLPGANWSKDRTKYCHFLKDYGHETNQCRELRHQIEEAVKSGQLAHLVKGVKKEKATGTRSEERKKKKISQYLTKSLFL
ncbi:hypothetical protein Tco_0569358 [Tanacetum coccineum]